MNGGPTILKKSSCTSPLSVVSLSQVVTDKNLYRLDAKSWKAHKAPTPLTAVSGFSMSAGEDQALIVHIHDDNDWVLTLRGNACAAELASLIAQAVGKM